MQYPDTHLLVNGFPYPHTINYWPLQSAIIAYQNAVEILVEKLENPNPSDISTELDRDEINKQYAYLSNILSSFYEHIYELEQTSDGSANSQLLGSHHTILDQYDIDKRSLCDLDTEVVLDLLSKYHPSDIAYDPLLRSTMNQTTPTYNDNKRMIKIAHIYGITVPEAIIPNTRSIYTSQFPRLNSYIHIPQLNALQVNSVLNEHYIHRIEQLYNQSRLVLDWLNQSSKMEPLNNTTTSPHLHTNIQDTPYDTSEFVDSMLDPNYMYNRACQIRLEHKKRLDERKAKMEQHEQQRLERYNNTINQAQIPTELQYLPQQQQQQQQQQHPHQQQQQQQQQQHPQYTQEQLIDMQQQQQQHQQRQQHQHPQQQQGQLQGQQRPYYPTQPHHQHPHQQHQAQHPPQHHPAQQSQHQSYHPPQQPQQQPQAHHHHHHHQQQQSHQHHHQQQLPPPPQQQQYHQQHHHHHHHHHHQQQQQQQQQQHQHQHPQHTQRQQPQNQHLQHPQHTHQPQPPYNTQYPPQ